jgi:hypothetical protein
MSHLFGAIGMDISSGRHTYKSIVLGTVHMILIRGIPNE